MPKTTVAPARRMTRLIAVPAVAATAVLALSGTAFAHVSVQPEGEAAKGGYATVNFKVPNESDKAATNKLEVSFPTDHPLASVMPQPVPGWDIKVTKSKLDKPLEVHGSKIDEAVSKVTWTADGDGVKTGEFQQFPVSIGALPENADQLVFKAVQSYDDKEVVRWIEEPKEGAAEPEHPAPVLELEDADDSHGDDSKAAAADKDDKDGDENAAESADSSDNTARVLGIVGIVVGAAGVAFGVLAGRRRTSS
ncbi:hypothetical protein DSC45_26825 [Streptomyces sp. YIM 130001]|uniref:YcnI family copper-binding membrane protein n=1 Tax=Streptomyces sp. YIM 130001 TaxID=2259644 RepID=UPI000E650610|nr:YcnI family protein [Streptomyces sp. YIM 130001]RII11916.1 hypothetical protein DSC45_26825 [Streptomyces sp. YIM 130001]